MDYDLSLTRIQPKNFPKRQYFQFFLIGSTNAIINLGFLNILLLIWPTTNEKILIIFNTLAYFLSMVNSYIWNSRIAFQHHARKDLREKVDFSIQAGVILIISNLAFLGGMHFLAQFQLSVWLIQNSSKIFAMVTTSIASFFSMKYFVFRRVATAQTQTLESTRHPILPATILITSIREPSCVPLEHELRCPNPATHHSGSRRVITERTTTPSNLHFPPYPKQTNSAYLYTFRLLIKG